MYLMMSQELNAFASGRLDFELEEDTTPAYGDAFAARPGDHARLSTHSGSHWLSKHSDSENHGSQ